MPHFPGVEQKVAHSYKERGTIVAVDPFLKIYF